MSKNSKFVGIDVAKKDFYACFEENGESKNFNNSKSGINEFVRHLRKNKFEKSETMIGLESTGSYHLRLCLQCSKIGFRIKVINPLIVKKQNQTNLRRVKNDKKDASLIRYCVSTGAGYEFAENAETLMLKSLVRQRNSLANNILKNKRQLEDVAYKEDCLNIKINSIYEEMQVILREKVKELEKQLRVFKKDDQKLLQTIPGVGPITAVSFIAEIGEINRFNDAKKLVAFVGLDSRVHESGTSVRGKGYISKRGNKILRTRLYNAASVAVLRPNIFQRFFEKKRSEGKPYKVALVATMNKMTHVIYSVWTNRKPFEEKQN
ncbi:IS110 family transposase [Patescibacteria group bacterium]|nr:IS110 family transposase [Patescibacteria group bacterium]